MSESSSHSSEQVEKIREILVGRQLGLLEHRLGSLEAAIDAHRGHAGGEALGGAESTHASVLESTEDLRRQLRDEAQIHSDQIARLTEQLNAASHQLEEASSKLVEQDRHVEQHLSEQLEHISSAMAARIDARVREVLQHLQSEIVQWKHQLDRDLLAVRHTKVDRQEVRNRFARLAAAAMEDPPPTEAPREDQGFLL
ncbi:MAG: hypothetical protein HKN82_07560 [Akkermansiaceae bacterium]|nr:hypothetical protein [Akkermansiaceae bacterium]NNM28861.1 hypothetical protein [Akkermansiaceae bacterium]